MTVSEKITDCRRFATFTSAMLYQLRMAQVMPRSKVRILDGEIFFFHYHLCCVMAYLKTTCIVLFLFLSSKLYTHINKLTEIQLETNCASSLRSALAPLLDTLLSLSC